MTTTRTQARIEADDKVPMIHIYRDFAATPAQLFRAHTDPELFSRWVGPTDIGADIDYWDARDGGSWRYTASRGGDLATGLPRLLPHGQPRADRADLHLGGHARGRGTGDLTFEDLGDGRTRLHATSLCDSFEARDGWLASGMESGVNDGYAALESMVEAGEL